MAATFLLPLALVALATCAPTAAPPPPSRPQAPPAPPPRSTAPPGGVPLSALTGAGQLPLRLARQVLADRAPRLGPLDREGVARVLAQADVRQGLPVLLLLGLIQEESRFDPAAQGPRGARGLMQLRPFVARAVAERAGWPFEDAVLWDPVQNVRLGVRYLAELQRRFGSAEGALAAYNIGPTRLRRRLAAGQPALGPYVRRVLERYRALRRAYGGPERPGQAVGALEAGS